MVIGAPALPDPFGHSWPVQESPDRNRMRSPGWNVVESTFDSEAHGEPGLVPEFESCPDVDT